MKILLFASILLFIACNSSSGSSDAKNDAPSAERLYGQKILLGKAIPAPDIQTLSCLDSLFTPDPVSRAFFFDVYKKIAAQADDELNEILGSYTRTFLQAYPHESAQLFTNASPADKKNFIQNLSREIYHAEDEEADYIEQFFTYLTINCAFCTIQNLKVLHEIKDEIKITTLN